METVFCRSSGQLRTFTPTPGSIRPDDGTLSDLGTPRKCCLDSAKGSEIPAPLALMDRTFFWLSWADSTWPVTPKSRVVVAGVEYLVHDVPSELTNQLLYTAIVSRLK